MSRRLKTLIAAIVIVFFWLPFYALAGTLWIVPIGLSLPWMYREPVRK